MTDLAVNITTSAGSFTVQAAFTANQGITALFGPSGSGKSLTLATIAGLLRPSAGTITMAGEVLADAATGVHVATQDRRVGMVFQHAALLPHRSPVDNVALAVRGVGNRAQRRRVAADWLEQVQAGHLAAAPTSTLSGGEQQRVALARALAGSPQVVLLDEPFSALDLSTRIALREVVKALVTERQLTLVMVTHDLDDVTTLADRVVMYEPGRSMQTHEMGADGSTRLARLLGLIP